MNALKEKLKNNKSVLGTFASIPSSSLANAIALSGLDFVIVDMEHGPITTETAEDMARAIEVSNATPIVRVSNNQADLILKVLDAGFKGVHIPQVSTKEEAEMAVRFSKYCPLGERGYTPYTRAGGYGLNAKTHAQDSNDETLVVVHVEGKKGIKNLEKIASVKGVDVVFIGPFDLSHSLGKPGQVEDEEIISAIRKSVEIAKAKGIVCGSYAKDQKYLETLMDCGVQYLTSMVDSAVVLNAYQQLHQSFERRRDGK